MVSASGFLFAALTRAVQICGALEAALTLTIEFAEQRVQFGRSLSAFQAIQHLLAEMGAEAAAASAAADAAVSQVQPGQALDFRSVAAAKLRASLAASIVCEHAHQIHGAIGYTQEYLLARLTRRLWQWRDDFGGESYWAGELGREALSNAGPIWPQLTTA
jgi:acyl-CoA dehydrogenase